MALAAIQLTALAFHGPAMWVAKNSRSYPDLGEAAAVSVAALLVAVGLIALLIRLSVSPQRSLAVLSAALLIFWNWRSLALPFLGAPAWLSAILFSGLLIWGAYLQGEHRLFRLAISTVGITLFVASVVVYALKTFPAEDLHILQQPPATIPTTLDRRPDIYVLMLDGYARADVLADLYDFDNGPFYDELRAEGFQVAESARSNYSITHFSLASFFGMEYPLQGDEPVTRTDLDAIQNLLAGKNRTVRFLKGLGYEYVQGSEAWWGTECSDDTDVCLPTPLIGRTAYELLVGTPLGPFIHADSGDIGTAIALERIDQIGTWEGSGGFGSESPDFVFIHMPIPHPPLFLDAACRPRLHEFAGGRILNQYPPILQEILEWRKVAYGEQIGCSNLVARKLIEAAPEDAVILIMSDHGPDSHGQLQRDPATLEPEAIWERLASVAAVRLPTDCEGALPDDVVVVNLMPIMANCVFGSSLPLRDPKFWLAPNTGTAAPLFPVEDPDRATVTTLFDR